MSYWLQIIIGFVFLLLGFYLWDRFEKKSKLGDFTSDFLDWKGVFFLILCGLVFILSGLNIL